jgi:hypothetical protein
VIRDVMWSAWEGPGLGHLRLAVRDSGVVANGVVLGVAEGHPFCVAYEVRCDANWQVRYWKLGLPLLVLFGAVAVFLVPVFWSF